MSSALGAELPLSQPDLPGPSANSPTVSTLRTTNLDSSAHDRTSSPPPLDDTSPTSPASLAPRLSISTTLSDPYDTDSESASASDAEGNGQGHEEDKLPEYTPGRFGRWQGWVEKRATERKDQGRPKTGWNLDEGPGSNYQPPSSPDLDGDRARGDSAEASPVLTGPSRIANPDISDEERMFHRSDSSLSSRIIRPGADVTPLTTSTSIHPIGSRFMKHAQDKPLCGATLPVSNKVLDGLNIERFVLIGTNDGLYLTDLLPSLGSSTLNTTPKSASDAVVYQLWTGLGVHQIEVHVEGSPQTRGSATGMRGAVIALVRQNGDFEPVLELRMWSLQTVINLAKWRCSSLSSNPIVMAPSNPQPPSRTDSKRSKGFFKAKAFVAATSSVREAKRSVTPEHESSTDSFVMVDSLDFPPGATPPRPTPSSIARASIEVQERQRTNSESSVGSITSEQTHHSRAVLLKHHRKNPSFAQPTATSAAASTTPETSVTSESESTTSLPTEWANSSVPLPLPPKNHTPVLFFNISPLPHQPLLPEYQGWLFLAIVTTKTVYIYESRPAERRTWVLSTEFYAPERPKLIHFVSLRPRSPGLDVGVEGSKVNLGVMLGTKEKCMIVRISDLAVSEIEIEGKRTPSMDSTTSLGARSVKRASRVASYVTGLMEARHGGIPAGVRGEERGLEFGRRILEGGTKGNTSSPTTHQCPPEEEGNQGWVGCEELMVDTRVKEVGGGRRTKSGWRKFLLLSKGSSTYLIPSPLPFQPSTTSSSENVTTPAIQTRPIHTFSWPSPIVKLSASIRTTSLAEDVVNTTIHLILFGFTKSGVSVQEGTILRTSLEASYAASSSSPAVEKKGTIWTPLSAYKGKLVRSPGVVTEVDPDLSGEASMDFGKEAGFVCCGGPWWSEPVAAADRKLDSDSEDEDGDGGDDGRGKREMSRGAFFWTRAHSDYPLRFVG